MSVEREIQDFISKLQNRIKTENVFEKIVEDHNSNKCTWDVAAKRRIGRIVEEVFKQCFLVQGDIRTERHHQIFVEGEGGLPEWWVKPYPLFGSRLYPDIGVLIPKLGKRVAIEVDHSQAEKTAIPGSKLKMALAKAAFGFLSHDWDYCYVLFHNQSGKPMEEYLNGKIEKDILDRYEYELHTRILLF